MSVGLTTHDWVMVLDSDEIVLPALGRRLRQIAETGEANVVRIPRRNVILGREMEHGQWWPNAKRRFFHKDHIDIRVEMHGGFHAAPGATRDHAADGPRLLPLALQLSQRRGRGLEVAALHDRAGLAARPLRPSTRARDAGSPSRRVRPGRSSSRAGHGAMGRPAWRHRPSGSWTASSSRRNSGTSSASHERAVPSISA